MAWERLGASRCVGSVAFNEQDNAILLERVEPGGERTMLADARRATDEAAAILTDLHRPSCLRACIRTSGTSNLPMPWASNSRAIVTRDHSPPSSGSIPPLAIAVSAPVSARTVHDPGGLSR